MNDAHTKSVKASRRNKLGLALAGGGFRASLFHLGVLRRMAELDLLRFVEVLSTVSGGSIIGALYILLLKKEFKKTATLTRADYMKIIEDLDSVFVAGIKKNLRTRLFMNPFGLLRVFVSSYSLGKRMSRLYERYLYRSVVDELQPASWWSHLWRPGKILLKDVLMRTGTGAVPGGTESYNRNAAANKGSVITTLVLNATSLNSGVPFRFSSVEIGDAQLGFFRYDEIPQLQKRRKLLFDLSLEELQAPLQSAGSGALTIRDVPYDHRTVSLIDWWRRKKEKPDAAVPDPTGWVRLFCITAFPGRILSAEFGLLRDVKLAAWYLRIGPTMKTPVTGGLTPAEHLELFWAWFRKIYDEQAANMEKSFKADPTLTDLLLDFVLELYYLRSAEVMSDDIEKHWNSLTLGEAVGASACFPPVFPPFITHDFYDDSHVSRLGLTDGGVYDNVGLTTLFAERCNYIIASDTGGLFVAKQQSSAGRMGMSGRIVGILQNDVGETQREVLRDRRNSAKRIEDLIATGHAPAEALTSSDLLGLAFFHIESPAIEGPGLMLDLDSKLLARLRTDLDGFGDVEIAALVNHGYDTADRYLRHYLAGSPYEHAAFWKPPQQEPKPIQRSPEDVNKILRVGKSRFFRALQLHAPVSIAFTTAIILGVVIVTWQTPLSVKDVIIWIANLSLGWVESLASFLGAGWTQHPIPVGVFLLVAVAVAVVIVTLKLKLAALLGWFKNSYLEWFSRLSTAYKWARSLSYNVIWVSGLLPLAIILGCSALAWVSHLFFYLPFKCKTRNRKT